MGNQQNKLNNKTSNQIDKKLKSHQIKQENIHSLLLLGPGESGKSTLMRQMRHIWGKQFQTKERESYRNIVWENLIECMQQLCKQSILLKNSNIEDCQIDEKIQDSHDFVVNKLKKTTKPFDNNIYQHFETLWDDEGIKNTFKHRDKFYLMDSAGFLLNNMQKFVGADYVPTFDEICRCRIRTLGIKQEEFVFNKVMFRVYDVGGQRSERRKWFEKFDNCRAIIYVTSLAGYNQVIFEDNKTNRLLESFDVYEKFINNDCFKKMNVILFLNKKDIFDQQIKTIPFTVCPCTDYKKGPNDAEAVVEYIVTSYQKKTEGFDTNSRSIFPHVTTATNTENVKAVFTAVRHIVLKNHLKDAAIIQ